MRPTGGTHLALNGDGNVHLDGSKLCEELLDSMAIFAGYLNQDAQTVGDDITEAKPLKIAGFVPIGPDINRMDLTSTNGWRSELRQAFVHS